MEPRIFKFGTPYEEMYRSLAATPDDAAFFVRNGVLQLCRRGAAVKVLWVNAERPIGCMYFCLTYTGLVLSSSSWLLSVGRTHHRIWSLAMM